MVKINGTAMDLEVVVRSWAPHRKNGLDFRPEDVTTLEQLTRREEYLRHNLPEGCKVIVKDRMGWRFLLWQDAHGNGFPCFFAPLAGKVEVDEDE